jgi:glycerol-3-phosphate dehydrogenase (NAD(P)+)
VKRLAIVGAGSWGTALAMVLAARFESVRLWVYEAPLAARMRATRENDVYLPGFQLPEHVLVTSGLEEALGGTDVVLSVMPSHLVRCLYEQMLPFLTPAMRFVSATKGLENGTLLRMSEVVASPSEDLMCRIQAAFSGPTFRLYTCPDPIGVEIGGAVKNVVAIGSGVIHGMGLGHNVTAALITRGLAEMTRLAVAMGGKPQTLAGLAGLGDLVLTCTGELSRNRTVGVELARGRKLEEIVSSMKMVAEGIKTTDAAVDLARRYSVEMPIAAQMFQMLHFGVSPREAIMRLMERSLKGE